MVLFMTEWPLNTMVPTKHKRRILLYCSFEQPFVHAHVLCQPRVCLHLSGVQGEGVFR